MANTWDDIKNGIVFGGLVGAFLLWVSTQIASINFFSNWMTSIANWITTQTWFPVSLASFAYWNYVVAILLGMIVGGYIDKK